MNKLLQKLNMIIKVNIRGETFEDFETGRLGGYFFKWRTVLYFFLETGKRYRPNSFLS